PLPPISSSVLIDGSSQPGYAGTPLIALSSQSAADSGVLTLADGQVTVRGLAIGRLAIEAATDERVVAQVHARGLTTRLSLRDAQGLLLVASDGLSPSNRDDGIDQHLPAGTYSLEVDSMRGTGDYVLTARASPASAPFQPLTIGRLSPRSFEPPRSPS